METAIELGRVLEQIRAETDHAGVIERSSINGVIRRVGGIRSTLTADKLVASGHLIRIEGGGRRAQYRFQDALANEAPVPEPTASAVRELLQAYAARDMDPALRELRAMPYSEREQLFVLLDGMASLVRLIRDRVDKKN